MGKAVRHMVEDALDVYLNSDEKRAYEIAASDESLITISVIFKP